MKPERKFRLLTALDSIVADVREAAAAIQRDDYDTAVEKFNSASVAIRAQAKELHAA